MLPVLAASRSCALHPLTWLAFAMQAYESMGDLERQADQVVPLQSRLELAVNERDAAIAKAGAMTPRPGVRAFDGLSPEGCKKLGAALDAHRFIFLLSVFAHNS